MRKFLPYIGIVFLLTILVTPTITRADQAAYDACVAANKVPPYGLTTEGICGSFRDAPAGKTYDSQDVELPTPKETGGGGWFTIAGLATGSIFAPVLNWIAYTMMKLTSLLVGIGGTLLNFAVDQTVIKMSSNISSMTGINIAWKVIRDFMNMFFIFLLVYKAILVIIAQNNLGDIKKFVTGIVLASVLINFSLFFTKIMIDASNVLTVGIYQNMIGTDNATDTGLNRGLSNALMQSLGLQGTLDSINLGNDADDYGFLVANLMSAVLFVITAFVFFAVSVMFVVRYIVLVVLLATSPIAYMGMAFDEVKAKANEWWKTLSGQLIFAPLFMLMMWVVLTLISSPGFLGENLNPTDWAALQKAQSGTDFYSSINLFFNFALVIGLTITALVTAKTYATKGAGGVKTLMDKAMTFSGNALMGGAAAIGRNTIGRKAASIADDKDLQRRADMGDKGARARLATAKYLSSKSFDVRRGFTGEQVASVTGVNFGKGLPFAEKAGEGGFAGTKDRKSEKERKDIDAIVRKYRADPESLAEYLYGRSDSDQKYIYDKLSARDRAAIDDQLDIIEEKKTGVKPLYHKNKITAKLRGDLSTEEREKTEKAAKEATKEAKSREKINALNQLANASAGTIDPATGAPYLPPINPATITPATPAGVPYTYADLLVTSPTNKFPPTEARKLSSVARMEPEVIKLLSPRHLADLMANGDMDSTEIAAIIAVIEMAPPYPLQAEQDRYTNTAGIKELWGRP